MWFLIFAVAFAAACKRWVENDYRPVRDGFARDLRRDHPEWSDGRVQRHARRRASRYWWREFWDGFPELKAAYAEEKEAFKLAREKTAADSEKRIRDMRDRVRRVREERQRMREQDEAERAATEARRTEEHARDEQRRQAEEDQRDAEPQVRCGRCRRYVAAKSLVWALTPSGTQEQMCASCRAEVKAEREADTQAAGQAGSQSDDDVTDAEVVYPELLPAGAEPRTAAEGPSPDPPMPQAPPQPTAPTVPVRPATQATTIEGASVPPRNPGQVVPRRSPAMHNTTAQAAAAGNGGQSLTHGQWERSTDDIRQRLDDLPSHLDAMLRDLHAADAGREQVQDVVEFRNRVLAYMAQVEAMMQDANDREAPFLAAVRVAGGVEEIPGIAYLRKV